MQKGLCKKEMMNMSIICGLKNSFIMEMSFHVGISLTQYYKVLELFACRSYKEHIYKKKMCGGKQMLYGVLPHFTSPQYLYHLNTIFAPESRDEWLLSAAFVFRG